MRSALDPVQRRIADCPHCFIDKMVAGSDSGLKVGVTWFVRFHPLFRPWEIRKCELCSRESTWGPEDTP